jgi:diacylglycerol kinase (ATP)
VPAAEVALLVDAAAGLSTYADGEPVGPLPATSIRVPGALRIVGSGGG